MGHWNLNFSKGLSTKTIPYFTEGGVRVLDIAQASQGQLEQNMLLESSPELGGLNDRASHG